MQRHGRTDLVNELCLWRTKPHEPPRPGKDGEDRQHEASKHRHVVGGQACHGLVEKSSELVPERLRTDRQKEKQKRTHTHIHTLTLYGA